MPEEILIVVIAIVLVIIFFLFRKKESPEDKVQRLIEKANKYYFTTETCRIAGIEYRGAKAIKIIKSASDDTFAELEPEPDNKYDQFAVKVLLDGVHVGYVPRKISYNIFHSLEFVEYVKLIDHAMIEGEPFAMIEIYMRAPTGLTDDEFTFIADNAPERLKELKSATHFRDTE